MARAHCVHSRKHAQTCLAGLPGIACGSAAVAADSGCRATAAHSSAQDGHAAIDPLFSAPVRSAGRRRTALHPGRPGPSGSPPRAASVCAPAACRQRTALARGRRLERRSLHQARLRRPGRFARPSRRWRKRTHRLRRGSESGPAGQRSSGTRRPHHAAHAVQEHCQHPPRLSGAACGGMGSRVFHADRGRAYIFAPFGQSLLGQSRRSRDGPRTNRPRASGRPLWEAICPYRHHDPVRRNESQACIWGRTHVCLQCSLFLVVTHAPYVFEELVALTGIEPVFEP